MKFRSLLAAGAALGVMAIPSSAVAATTTDTVTGTALGTLAIAVGVNPGFGTALAPGASLTDNGTLIVTSTNPAWTLQANDQSATAPGELKAATPGALLCAGSENNLQNPLGVHVTASGAQDPGTKALSGTLQTVASATAGSPLPLAAGTLNTTYTQSIAANEILTAGCAYSVPVSYTIQ